MRFVTFLKKIVASILLIYALAGVLIVTLLATLFIKAVHHYS